MTRAELVASLKRAVTRQKTDTTHAKEHERKAKKYRLSARVNKALAARRRKQIAARTPTGPDKAVAWALKQVGTVENPPGSNRGGRITEWQQALGSWLIGQAWCGTFVGTALKQAGVSGITSRVAAVAFIEDDARAGRNGFVKLVPKSEARRGDVAILFGRGVHTELIVANHGTYLENVGGNTSSGTSGDQANGGGVFRRNRPMSQVYAVARPNY